MEDATLGIRRQGLGGAEVIKRKERLLSAVLLSQAIAFCIALTSLSSTLLASKVRFASQSAYLGMPHCRTVKGVVSPIGVCHPVTTCPIVFATFLEAYIIPVSGFCQACNMGALCRGSPYQPRRQYQTMLCSLLCTAPCSCCSGRSRRMAWGAMQQ